MKRPNRIAMAMVMLWSGFAMAAAPQTRPAVTVLSILNRLPADGKPDRVNGWKDNYTRAKANRWLSENSKGNVISIRLELYSVEIVAANPDATLWKVRLNLAHETVRCAGCAVELVYSFPSNVGPKVGRGQSIELMTDDAGVKKFRAMKAKQSVRLRGELLSIRCEAGAWAHVAVENYALVD